MLIAQDAEFAAFYPTFQPDKLVRVKCSDGESCIGIIARVYGSEILRSTYHEREWELGENY